MRAAFSQAMGAAENITVMGNIENTQNITPMLNPAWTSASMCPSADFMEPGALKNMTSPNISRDLTKQAPHSPRERLAGFATATRVVDKCRASLAGTLGEYLYDCPLDNLLFDFKGITSEQFKTAVQASTSYEDVGRWLLANGTTKTPVEIKAWSYEMEASNPMKNPEKRTAFIQYCSKLMLNPQMNSMFDLLEADDRASFSGKSV